MRGEARRRADASVLFAVDLVDQAGELCDDEAPKIELWQAARLVDEIDCDPEDKD